MALIAVGRRANVTPAAGILGTGLTGWRIAGVERVWLMALDECLGRLSAHGHNPCGRKPKRIDFNLANPPERYVGRIELGQIMGVSLATIDRLVAEGMPSVTWGRRTRRFSPSAAISWASTRRRRAA